MNINPELKRMWQLALATLAVILIVANVVTWAHPRYRLPRVSYASQLKADNRLRHPNLNHASSVGKYPRLTNRGHLTLVALPAQHRLYLTTNSKVLYACHATVSRRLPQRTVISGSYGQQNVHVNHGQESTAVNWTSIGSHYYLESPQTIAGRTVHGNWIRNNVHLENAILVSKADAHWLQQLPTGTTVIVKSR